MSDVRHPLVVRRGLLVVALLALAALVVVAGIVWTDALYLAPALLLAAVLMSGRYLGEDAIVALRLRARATPSHRRVRAAARRRPELVLPRGGRLVAARLAGRAPPAALACA